MVVAVFAVLLGVSFLYAVTCYIEPERWPWGEARRKQVAARRAQHIAELERELAHIEWEIDSANGTPRHASHYGGNFVGPARPNPTRGELR
jgi:hypothetical protein